MGKRERRWDVEAKFIKLGVGGKIRLRRVPILVPRAPLGALFSPSCASGAKQRLLLVASEESD